MKVRRALIYAACAAILAAGSVAAAQPGADEQRALRERIEARFDVVPLTDGIALRPRSSGGDVRLIEVSDSGIAINGTPVTGRELRDRLGEDADLVLRLSYLDTSARRSLFEATRENQPGETLPPAGTAEPAPPGRPDVDEDRLASRARRRARGDRVRVFGSVNVDRDERIEGQAVAVIGSVRVDGEVGDQVVAVLGSVDLGPEAIVHGDIVSVGGRVRRAPGAQVRGGVTEVALSGAGSNIHVGPWFAGFGPWSPFDGAVPRLVLTTFRLVLLILLASAALMVARTTVERSAQRVTDEPLKSTVVGVIAQLLLIPVLVVGAIVLAISIIGIPLLLLLPFAVLFLLLMALAGFTGTAYAVGQWARRRFGLGAEGAWFEMAIGIVLILLPLLIGRLIGLAGWAAGPFAFLLIATGFALEYLAWASGFGAVLTNAFTGWQARRAARAVPVPAAPPAATTTTTTTTTEL